MRRDPETTSPIDTLTARLGATLMQAYGRGADPALGSHPMQQAFDQFGAECAAHGFRLEETMAAATGALQDFLARIGALSSDPATTIAAGIALAAASRSHLEETIASTPPVQEAGAATQLARLDALHQINRAATSTVNIQELLNIAVQMIVRSTQAEACSIALLDEANDVFVIRAASGLNPAAVGTSMYDRSIGITGAAVRERRSILVRNVHEHPDYISPFSTGEAVYASQGSIPMYGLDVEVPVGAINVYSVRPRDFTPDEIAFLETIAGELAISIENVRMRRETDETLRRKLTELGALQRVTRSLASSLDLPNVLQLITEAAVKLIDAEAAAIFRVPRRMENDIEPVPVIESRTGETRQVLDQSRREALIRNVIEHGSAQISEMDYVDGQQALFCLPLRSARETWGALCLRLRAGIELTDDDLGLLQAFTDSASLAIENAQLYLEAMRGVETASTLLQEMHHRVRNNLQTVAALLSIQMRQDPDGKSAASLREAVSRIQAIAAVHDLLSDERRLSGTTVDAIARLVAEEARSTVIPPGKAVTFTIEASEIEVPSKQTTVLALLLNELVSNAIAHGFRGRDRGQIRIRAFRHGGFATVEVENDGHQVANDFDPSKSTGLGMRIVQRLVTSDLQGFFSVQPTGDGTMVTITFPLPSDQQALAS